MTDKERIAELETQLENVRRLLQISDGRAARLSGEVDELEARLELWRRAERGALAQMAETNERFEGALSTIAELEARLADETARGEAADIAAYRITELEAALTDALYAWAMVNSVGRTAVGSWDAITNIRDFKKAGERIQRARLALPKESEGKHTCSPEKKH